MNERTVNQRLLGSHERIFSWFMLHDPGHITGKSTEELIDDFFEVFGGGDSQSSLSLLGDVIRSITGNLQIQEIKLRSVCLQLISGVYRIAAEVGDVNRNIGPEKNLWERILNCKEEPELLQETVRMITGRICRMYVPTRTATMLRFGLFLLG